MKMMAKKLVRILDIPMALVLFVPMVMLKMVRRMGVHPVYEAPRRADGLLRPPEHMPNLEDQLVAAEIPADFMSIKAADLGLARDWRFFAREFFETAFAAGYIVTDFAFDRDGQSPRGIYILTDGESTLESGR